MRLIYCRSLTVGGFAIRAGQGFGQWTHAGIVLPEGVVISARAFKGVVAEQLEDFVQRYSTVDIVEKHAPNDEAGYALARKAATEHWPYDYGALWGFITHKLGHFERPDAVECLELLEMCLAAAGRDRFTVAPDCVTLQQSYITR